GEQHEEARVQRGAALQLRSRPRDDGADHPLETIGVAERIEWRQVEPSVVHSVSLAVLAGEPLTQLPPCMEEVRAHRTLWEIEQGRDLPVLPSFQVMEQHDFALHFVEVREPVEERRTQ